MWVAFLEILAAVVYANFLEWYLHRKVLHDWGRYKNSPFSFHWHTHHKTARQTGYSDPDYLNPWWTSKSRVSEVVGLFLLALSHCWLAWDHPGPYAVLVMYCFLYYFVHKYSHLYPAWGRKYFPWHYDHHMAGNQSHSWCVVFPLWDRLMGTGKP